MNANFMLLSVMRCSIWKYSRAGARSLLFDGYLEIDNHATQASEGCGVHRLLDEEALNTCLFFIVFFFCSFYLFIFHKCRKRATKRTGC